MKVRARSACTSQHAGHQKNNNQLFRNIVHLNLYEFEGKVLLKKHGIATPCSIVVRQGEDSAVAYQQLGVQEVVTKAQILSGERAKKNLMRYCSNKEDVKNASKEFFDRPDTSAVLIEEKIDIADEHYVSISYDTNAKAPVFMYAKKGGIDVENHAQKMELFQLDIRNENVFGASCDAAEPIDSESTVSLKDIPFAQELWNVFLQEDARQVEVNPLAKTTDGRWVAIDAKIALDPDAFFRHKKWTSFEARSLMRRPPTEREIAARRIDDGEKYYQGTAGKYIEMDGDIATLFSGGGASIANMDALIAVGLSPANYAEYSGNPPREKVYELTKIVLSKPNLRGLWICGVVSNFTNIKETFLGIADALDEMKPPYPIVVRRDGPGGEEGRQILKACAKRNKFTMEVFGKETSMTETATRLATLLSHS